MHNLQSRRGSKGTIREQRSFRRKREPALAWNKACLQSRRQRADSVLLYTQLLALFYHPKFLRHISVGKEDGLGPFWEGNLHVFDFIQVQRLLAQRLQIRFEGYPP